MFHLQNKGFDVDGLPYCSGDKLSKSDHRLITEYLNKKHEEEKDPKIKELLEFVIDFIDDFDGSELKSKIDRQKYKMILKQKRLWDII